MQYTCRHDNSNQSLQWNLHDICLNIETNNQQDVSEFTHIVLEWVEDAFKGDSKQGQHQKSENCTAMQTDEGEPGDGKEKENNEEILNLMKSISNMGIKHTNLVRIFVKI